MAFSIKTRLQLVSVLSNYLRSQFWTSSNIVKNRQTSLTCRNSRHGQYYLQHSPSAMTRAREARSPSARSSELWCSAMATVCRAAARGAIYTSHVTLRPLSRRTCTPSPAIRLLFTVLSNRENGMGHAVTANFQQIAIFYCFGRFIQILNSMRLISSVVDRRCLDVQS